jgi:hypothetical protein
MSLPSAEVKNKSSKIPEGSRQQMSTINGLHGGISKMAKFFINHHCKNLNYCK